MTEDLARDDWDKHWADFSEASEKGPATLYRHSSIIRLLDIPGDGQNVRLLDIGSGTGGFAKLFCATFPQAALLGLELSEAGVMMAKARVPGASFEKTDLLQGPDTDDPIEFNATHAICSEVLEHLDDPVRLLRNARRYMAPGCRLVVTVPGGKPNKFDVFIGHRKHYTGEMLRIELEAAGFDVNVSTGSGFPFFNAYRMLTTMRGDQLKRDVSGKPSWMVRVGSVVFGILFRFNLKSYGWQTVAVCRSAAGKSIPANT